MEYTHSQKNALERFTDFLKNNHQIFILEGAAGTGKTTILKQMIEEVNRANPDWNRVVLLAPTGRAAHILRQKTGHEASTIHKMIYSLKEVGMTSIHPEDLQEDETEVKLRFELVRDFNGTGMVYFVDESSLISNAYSDNEAFQFGSGFLLNDLMEFVRNNKKPLDIQWWSFPITERGSIPSCVR